MLAAWLLLGWLGQRLGWSMASGLLPVVCWWAARCAVTARTPRHARAAGWVSPLLLGVLWVLPTGPVAQGVLLLAAALWGCGSGALAAAMGPSRPTPPGLAMGLMMGSLWLSGQWCLGPGWTDTQSVALHLGLMVGVPGALALARPARPTMWVHAPLVLLAAGALCLAWPDAPAVRLPGMVLLVLAWALPLTDWAPHVARSLPTGLGPLLLLAVGLLAPTHGPTALQAAWWVVAALAVAPAVPWWPNRPAPALSPHRWSDLT